MKNKQSRLPFFSYIVSYFANNLIGLSKVISLSLPGWSELNAVKAGKVFLVDADLFTQPSTTLVDGIELLAAIFHPQLFDVPPHLQHKVKKNSAIELDALVAV